jgi:hypothetical protein
MATIKHSSNEFFSTMLYKTNQRPMTIQSRLPKSKIFRNHEHFRFGKVFKSKEQPVEFPSFSLLGGNRKDPLNLNELIQKSKQLSINNHDYTDTGNDRPVEIFLQPNIFDPLCLDISSHNTEDSIPSNSNNQPTYIRRNFRNYDDYRQAKHGWVHDK